MPSAQSVLAGSPCSEHWLLLSSRLWCWKGVCSKGTAGDLLTSLRAGSLALDQKAVHLQPWFSLGVLLMVPKVNTAVTSSRWPGGTGFHSPVELLGPQGACRSSRRLGASSRPSTLSARPGLDWPVSPPPPAPIPLSLFCSLCVVSSVAPRAGAWSRSHVHSCALAIPGRGVVSQGAEG